MGVAVGTAVWQDLIEYKISPPVDLMTRYLVLRLDRAVMGTAPDPFALVDWDRVYPVLAKFRTVPAGTPLGKENTT